MVHTIVAFLWRKPGISPEAFRDYYENNHMKLLLSVGGDAFPLTHTRHYVPRKYVNAASSDITNTNFKPTVYGGTTEFFDFDCYTEMTFKDFDHFMAFNVKILDADANSDEWKKDQANFVDTSEKSRQIVLLDTPITTNGPA